MSAPGAHDSLATLAASRGVAVDRVRPFGSDAADLEIRFDAPRAVVVTDVLCTCLGLDAPAVWELPLSTRLLLLVGVSELTAPPIEVHLECACGEQAEIELPATELAAFAAERAVGELAVDGLQLRLPTGRDQLRWTVLAASGDETELATRVLADLVVEGGELTDEMVPAVDRALADADPLVELRLDSTCPACDAPLAKEVDLEAIGLSRLRYVWRAMLEDVHVLASAYHWSEEQVARMPAWRRAEYRTLLGRSRS